jgi:phosphoglycolate phosphatase
MLVLFDLDGTIIDSEPGIFGGIRHALNTLDAPVPDAGALRDWIGPPLRQNFSALLDSAGVDRAVELYHEYFSAQGWREREVYEGMPEVMQALVDQGHTLALVTSKTRKHAEAIVADVPFGPLLKRIYAPGPEVAHSLKASMISAALSDFNVEPGNAVMIGDRNFDIEGAAANKVASIGVLWGFGSETELTAAGATVLAAAPTDLLPLIGTLALR